MFYPAPYLRSALISSQRMKAAVFFPKKRQRNAGLCEFTVDIRIIRFNVSADFLVLVWEKNSFQLGVGNVLAKGSVDIGLACYL